MPGCLRVRRIAVGEVLDFSCSDRDLSEFFTKDWVDYANEMMAVTYSFELDEQIIAMFSLQNDKMEARADKTLKAEWEARFEHIPERKRGHRSFPAVKIGRLAVRQGLEGKGIGSAVLAFVQAFFLLRNKTGCRFLTVDSYPGAVGFYSGAGFIKVERPIPVIPTPEATQRNTLMYMDLKGSISEEMLSRLEPCIKLLLQDNQAEMVGFGDGFEKTFSLASDGEEQVLA